MINEKRLHQIKIYLNTQELEMLFYIINHYKYDSYPNMEIGKAQMIRYLIKYYYLHIKEDIKKDK